MNKLKIYLYNIDNVEKCINELMYDLFLIIV